VTRKVMAVVALLMVVALTAASLIAGASLPEGVQLPVHWGFDGEPDRFAGKWTALLTPPVLVAALSLLFYFLPALEPRREGLARSQGLYLWGWLALLVMGALVEIAMLSVAFDRGLSTNHLIIGGVGGMLVLIGNQLGKSRRMYLVGVRTPWTLASEEVWIKTHRLAGKLMVGGGVLIVLLALLLVSPGLLAAAGIGVVIVAAGVPVIYSYFLWRREMRSGSASG
jgi:uncharacterized membrane protein